MTKPVPDLLTLAARLKKIEKQNRWLKFFCLLMLASWLLGGNLGGTLAAKIVSGPPPAALEAQASPAKPGQDLTKLEEIINPQFIKKTFKQVVDGLNRTR